ncbi:family 16 glycosylhydrolase [Flavobacteriaceae bacterium]|nr:family 16 glycosylhydrolase [Flavobacteriaceae bacterium]
MKTFKKIIGLFILSISLFTSCQDEDQEFGALKAPSNITLNYEVLGQDADNPNGDGSGIVNFSATADDAITYIYSFGDNTDNASAPSGNSSHRFTRTGLSSYNVTVTASGLGGVTSSKSINIEVFSAFDDIEAKSFLSGAPISQDSDGVDVINISSPATKVWYLDDSKTGHLGVGPSLAFDIQIYGAPREYYYPSFFSAAPGTFCGNDGDCFCDDELIFTLNPDGSMNYLLDNKGTTFFNGNAAHQAIAGGAGGGDACLDFDTSTVSNVSFAPGSEDWSLVADPSFESRGTQMNFSDSGFMSYYVGSSSYEIIEITETELYVRTLDAADPNLAWYHKFTSTPGGSGSDDEYVFTDLVWEDDFNTDGAPDSTKWTYDLGTTDIFGNTGWGNQEAQSYTDNAENVIVEGGSLKITAKKEGNDYTSARIKTQGLYDFTYGRVEVRAKLPASQGTWPAIWMLGSNHPTAGWPYSGEVDIMEQRGDDKERVLGTSHWYNTAGSNNASYGESTTVENPSTEFHLYTVEWTEGAVKIFLDDVKYYELTNSADLPFNADFYLILNVAMGGTLGGDIDPSFTQDTMEIDYIKVFQ